VGAEGAGVAKLKRGSAAPVEQITQVIQVLRGQRVLLDAELAALYGVTTKRLNEQVRRNAVRFPADFMFQLTVEEAGASRSQNATLKAGRGQHRKYLPFAFTEHGAIQAANVLNSPRAVDMSIYVVRALVQLRTLLASNTELARRLNELETRIERSSPGRTRRSRRCCQRYALMNPPIGKSRGIRFTADLGKRT
jgi:hypothetical protein